MSSLSEQQSSVVSASFLGLGPVVVKAGPGSGKTHTVVSLIHEHLSQGVLPQDVIAITFTRRAARELKERLGDAGRKVQASTIDALALGIAKSQLPDEKLLSPTCYQVLFQVACDLNRVKATPDRMENLSKMREAPFLKHEPDASWREMRPVQESLDLLMEGAGYSDYLGLLLRAIWVIKSAKYRPRCRLLIVDEAQDTSKIQWLLIEELVKKTGAQLVIVGDMNQNIYSWRNAAPEVFYHYATHEQSIALPLKESFRCQPKIVRASNHLIEFNPDAEADVVSVRDGVFSPVTVSSERPVIEVLRLLDEIYAQDEIAVLCRTNRTVEYVSRELIEAGVECNTVYPVEAKASFLAMAAMFGADQHNLVNQILLKEAAKQIGWSVTGDDAEEIICSLLRQRHGAAVVRYLSQCASSDLVFAEALIVVDGIPDLRQSVAELKARFGGLFVPDAIDRLLAPGEVEASSGAVTVSTIHQAKGLEWPAVVIADLKEGVFPSKRSARSESGIIEERRLMYVAMTRAKDRLVLCADPVSPSQFVFAKEYYDAEEISGLGTQAIREAGW